MLTIYGRTNSSNVQKVLWCCAEIGLAFRLDPVGREHGRNHEPWYLALNPNGRVPTIDDDGFVLWESNAIVRYLAARYGSAGFSPADLQRRAEADRWMDWQQTVLAQPMTDILFGLVRTPPDQRDAAAIERARQQAAAAWLVLEGAFGDGAYLNGDTLTMADIPFGPFLYRWFNLGLETPDLPRLKAWYERLVARSAFRVHIMVPIT